VIGDAAGIDLLKLLGLGLDIKGLPEPRADLRPFTPLEPYRATSRKDTFGEHVAPRAGLASAGVASSDVLAENPAASQISDFLTVR
jgi:hypothetical protein